MPFAKKLHSLYTQAESRFRQALQFEKAVQKFTGQGIGVAHVCTSLGLLLHRQGRISEAEVMLAKAIEIYSRSTGHERNAALVYASAGKLLFDAGDDARAEESSVRALAIYQRLPRADAQIRTINQLLDVIRSRRANDKKDDTGNSTYRNPEYRFSFQIPPGWTSTGRAHQFATTGGLIAIAHVSGNAAFNVSVGRLDHEQWRSRDVRAAAVREFIKAANAKGREVSISTQPVSGEENTVTAEWVSFGSLLGRMTDATHGLTPMFHDGLEYTLQWAAARTYEDSARAIVTSFRFDE